MLLIIQKTRNHIAILLVLFNCIFRFAMTDVTYFMLKDGNCCFSLYPPLRKLPSPSKLPSPALNPPPHILQPTIKFPTTSRYITTACTYSINLTIRFIPPNLPLNQHFRQPAAPTEFDPMVIAQGLKAQSAARGWSVAIPTRTSRKQGCGRRGEKVGKGAEGVCGGVKTGARSHQ
jgi:hypothetical protein